MNHLTHRFSTPFARDLFSMGVEAMLEIERFSDNPITLHTASPKAIKEELDRLERIRKREHRGTPHEL